MVIIGIAGGTGSGKSTLVQRLLDRFPESKIAVLPLDAYYKDNSHLTIEKRIEVNYDHPDSVEFTLLCEHLTKLKNGESIRRPTYSYLTCARSSESIKLEPADVVIVEGNLVLVEESILKMIDLRLFVEAAADERLIRVINRDTTKRGRSLEKVLERYQKTVKPMHKLFVEPSKSQADIIFPHGADNLVALDFLCTYIQKHLKD